MNGPLVWPYFFLIHRYSRCRVAAETEIQFDGWTVNRVSGELRRDDRASRLQQQPLRILIELYDHAGEIVTREQLVKALWPQGVVDFDNGLNVAVRKLRVALDDVGDAPKYIETLPRVGYRFIAMPGNEAAVPPAPTRGLSRRIRTALIGCLLISAISAFAWWAWSTAPQANPARAHSGSSRHEPSERAREFYLEGLRNRSRRDIDPSQIALDSFMNAVREDPNFPDAWAAIADLQAASVIRQRTTWTEAHPVALEAAKRAIELDEANPHGHVALAMVLMDLEWDFTGAQRELERARELNPEVARIWHHYGMWHARQGHVDEGLRDLRKARELEPMLLLFQSNYALILYNARRYDEVIAFLTPVVEANPNFVHARSVLANAMIATGDLAGAEKQLKLRPSNDLFQAEAGFLAAKQGNRDAALSEIARLEQLASKGFGTGYAIAVIHAALGDLDRGCEYLARGVDDRSMMLVWMRLDPHLDPLRGRQCFADVERRVYAKSGGRGQN